MQSSIVFHSVHMDNSQTKITRQQPVSTPTDAPTPTDIPVSKADMRVIVLNGGGVAGAAKSMANKLTLELEPDYSNIEQQESIDSAHFTIVLGKQ